MSTPARRRAAVTPAVDGALLLVSVVAGAGLGRLSTAPASVRVLAPALACVVAGQLVVAVVQRVAPTMVAALAGAVAVVVVCTWTFVPGSTAVGFPTAASLHQLGHLLDVAGTVIRGQATPIPATAGVRLWIALGAGAMSVMARALLGWRGPWHLDSALVLALVPPVAAFAYTALLSSEVDRVQGAVAMIVALACYGVVAERPWLSSRTPRTARTVRKTGAGAAVAVAIMAVAVAVPVAVSPALAGMTVDAVPFTAGVAAANTGSAGVAGITVVDAEDLIANLRAVLVGRANETLFEARSPIPTYWQLATLTRFDGTAWTPDDATTQAAHANSVLGPFSPSLVELQQTRMFQASVVLDAIRTPLLPVPPGVQSITGVSPVALVPSLGAYITPSASAGFSYRATSVVTPSNISGGGADAPASALAPYLALPRLPAAVVSLARRIVRGAGSPVAEAVDLVRYFGSSRFHYSVSAPTSSSDPLSSFLFDTRTGFCQQFAGAYGVLARIVGLPTRLAVGFTPGTQQGGVYRVTGADAHVWPQVYLGPALGWVSFEPTPPAGAQPGAPGVFTASSPIFTVVPQQLLTRPPPAGDQPALAKPSHSSGAAGTNSRRNLNSVTQKTGVGGWPWGLIVFGAMVVAIASVLTRRRWWRHARRGRARMSSPRRAVLAQWRDAAEELSRWRLGRQPSETVTEHARRVRDQAPGAGVVYEQLARLAERASYAPLPVTAAEAAAARRLRAEVCAELGRRRRDRSHSDLVGARR